jgi:hypothetical protein
MSIFIVLCFMLLISITAEHYSHFCHLQGFARVNSWVLGSIHALVPSETPHLNLF